MHGQGFLLWNDGIKYEGTFVAGFRNGKGKMTWESGSTYEGFYFSN